MSPFLMHDHPAVLIPVSKLFFHEWCNGRRVMCHHARVWDGESSFSMENCAAPSSPVSVSKKARKIADWIPLHREPS
jgi:hypothetical protein